MKKLFYHLSLAVLVLAGLLASGCKSTEPENVSSRPWNSPKGWEGGIPGFNNEGR
jgi:hypothetical protein